MTHEQRLKDLLADPVFSQGLSPQEAKVFQAMCGELSGLASQIAGAITAEKADPSPSAASVDVLTLFQHVSAVLGDDAEEETLWEQFREQVAEAQATLVEIYQCPVSTEELDRARRQVEGLLRLIDQVSESGDTGIRQPSRSFWNTLSCQVKAVLFYKLF